MNPVEALRLKAQIKDFGKEHPKFTAFLRYAADHSLEAGSIVDVTIRRPEGGQTHANLRLSEADAKLLQSLRVFLQAEK